MPSGKQKTRKLKKTVSHTRRRKMRGNGSGEGRRFKAGEQGGKGGERSEEREEE